MKCLLLAFVFALIAVFGFGFVYGQSVYEPQVVVVEKKLIVTIEKTVEMEDGWKKISGIDISWR